MTKKLPKISVITPSLNQKKYIETTIKSVLSQKYPNLEYIIMDGGSTDGTLDILKKYGNQIIWHSSKDEGQTDAINKGFNKSSGDILSFINSDDYYAENTLQQVSKFFLENDRILWLTGKCKVINGKNEEIRSLITLWKNLWIKKDFLNIKQKDLLLSLNFISQPSTFWRREAWEKTGQFDNSLIYTMDYDYWLRLFKISELGFINKELSYFRVHPKSKGFLDTSKQIDEGYKVMKNYTNSISIKILHRMHDFFTLAAYKLLNI